MDSVLYPLEFNVFNSFDSSNSSSSYQHQQRERRVLWTDEESNMLRQLKEEDLPFTEICREINVSFETTKTPAMVEERWSRVMAPGIIKGKWGSEEDLELKRLITFYNGDLKSVQKNFNGRTLLQIRRRATSLKLI